MAFIDIASAATWRRPFDRQPQGGLGYHFRTAREGTRDPDAGRHRRIPCARGSRHSQAGQTGRAFLGRVRPGDTFRNHAPPRLGRGGHAVFGPRSVWTAGRV
ncbi:MAG: hypothetical protein CMO01_04825 [Thalassobius sp.]|nr:hypothetical protein [Thalassovita sp.]